MHITHKTFIIISLFLLLIGCATNRNNDTVTNDDIKFTQLNTKDPIEQQISNQAKENLSKYDEVTSIQAVNTDKDIIITIEVKHFKRFQLKKIKKKIIKATKKDFPDMNVVISTDKKIIIELEQLEQDIDSDSISKKKLDKKVKELVKLANDQT